MPHDPAIWPYTMPPGPPPPEVYTRLRRPERTPRVFVSNWASAATLGHHGRGKRWSLVPAPGARQNGDGWVECFIPDADAYQAARDGDADGFLEGFAAAVFASSQDGARLRPGMLSALYGAQPPAGVEFVGGDRSHRSVRDGDTLCCVCSRKTTALDGSCHRVVVAHALTAAGWEVVLDGVPIGAMPARPELARRQDGAPVRQPAAKKPKRERKRRALPMRGQQLGLGLGR